MSKPKYRKCRPSPPHFWRNFECCALCKDKNNCSQCKHSRDELKGTDNRRDKRQKLKGSELE